MMFTNALLTTAVALTGTVSGLAIRQASTPDAGSAEPWTVLPPTPALPAPINTVLTPINGIQMWFQKYNEKAGAVPIVMDHGGLGYSAYFGSVISRLISDGHYVIAVDRRGHGRSTFNAGDVFTFDQMAADVYALLSGAGVTKYNVVGWSDGAITTLAAMMNATMAKPIQKAYLYGTTTNPDQVNASFANTAIFNEFVTRCATEYAQLQPKANFTDFANKVATMENTLPQWTDADLAKVDGSKVMIADGQYEEGVKLDVPAQLNKAIVGSQLTILANVSHFGPMQDPEQFTKSVEAFLTS